MSVRHGGYRTAGLAAAAVGLVLAGCSDGREARTEAGARAAAASGTAAGGPGGGTAARRSPDLPAIAIPPVAAPEAAPTPVLATPSRPAAAFRPSDDPLGLLASGRGPDLDLAWPEAPRERAALWSVLTRLGARAVYADTDPGGPAVVGPSDGAEFRAGRYSPLVRLTDLRGLEPVEALERLRAARPHVHTAYVLPRDLDARLLAAIERSLGRRMDDLSSVSGHIEARDGQAAIRISEVDGEALDPPPTVRVR